LLLGREEEEAEIMIDGDDEEVEAQGEGDDKEVGGDPMEGSEEDDDDYEEGFDEDDDETPDPNLCKEVNVCLCCCWCLMDVDECCRCCIVGGDGSGGVQCIGALRYDLTRSRF